MNVKVDANYNTLRKSLMIQLEKNGGKTDGVRLNRKSGRLYAKSRKNFISFSSKRTRNAKYAAAANTIKESINREFKGQKIGGQNIGDFVFQQLGNPKKINLATLKQIDLSIATAVKQASQNSSGDVQRMADHYSLLVDANHDDMQKDKPQVTHQHLTLWKDVVTGREAMREAIIKDLSSFPGNHNPSEIAEKMLLDTKANLHGLTWETFDRTLEEVGKLFGNPRLNIRTAMPRLTGLIDTLATKKQVMLNAREAKSQDTALDKSIDRNPTVQNLPFGQGSLLGVALDQARVNRSSLLANYAAVARQHISRDSQTVMQLRDDLVQNANQFRALADSIPTTLEDLNLTVAAYKAMSPEERRPIQETLSANGDVAQNLRNMATSTRGMALSLTSYNDRALDLDARPMMSSQAELQGNSGLNQTSPQHLFINHALRDPKLIVDPKSNVKVNGDDLQKNRQIQKGRDYYNRQLDDVNVALAKYQATGSRQDLQTLARTVEDALMSNTDMTLLTSSKSRRASLRENPSDEDRAMISNTSLLKAQARGLRALSEMITIQNDQDRLNQIVHIPMQDPASAVLPPQPQVRSDQELHDQTGMDGEPPEPDDIIVKSDTPKGPVLNDNMLEIIDNGESEQSIQNEGGINDDIASNSSSDDNDIEIDNSDDNSIRIVENPPKNNVFAPNDGHKDWWDEIEAREKQNGDEIFKKFEDAKLGYEIEAQNKANDAAKKAVENDELIDIIQQVQGDTAGNDGEIDPDIVINKPQGDGISNIDVDDILSLESTNNNNNEGEKTVKMNVNVDVAKDQDIDEIQD